MEKQKMAIVVDKDYGSVTAEDLETVKEALEAAGIGLRLCHFTSEQEILEHCKGAEALLCTGNPPITGAVLEGLPDLKIVQRFGIGVNSIDLAAATRCKKIISYMPGFCVDELAAHAASMILGLIRNTVYYDRHIRNGEWPKGTYFVPKNVSQMTLGLYGFGGSARPLCRIFREGFGSRILACDPYVGEETKKEYSDVRFVSFDELLKQSDIISIHVPLNQETYHIFGEQAFRKMKQDAILVNISRGGIIDQEALADALEQGNIRGAGLDVFETEPLGNDRLKEMENVILTPHSAFYGEGSKQRQIAWASELVKKALREETMEKRFVANKEVCGRMPEFKFT